MNSLSSILVRLAIFNTASAVKLCRQSLVELWHIVFLPRSGGIDKARDTGKVTASPSGSATCQE